MDAIAKQKNPMDVVGHNDEDVDVYIGKMSGYLSPASFDRSGRGTWAQLVFHKTAEHLHPAMSADRYEVRTRRRVVVVREAHSLARRHMAKDGQKSITGLCRFTMDNVPDGPSMPGPYTDAMTV